MEYESECFPGGSIAFELGFMRRTIGIGVGRFTEDGIFHGFDAEADPYNLNLGVWLHFVPEAFKEHAKAAVEAIAPVYLKRPIRDQLVERVILHLQQEVLRRVALEGRIP